MPATANHLSRSSSSPCIGAPLQGYFFGSWSLPELIVGSSGNAGVREGWRLQTTPKGFKVPKHEVSMISVLAIVIMVWGIYVIFGYLDP